MSEQTLNKPWYRHPMVWLVICIPLSSVIAGIWYIYLATTNPNDVIKDNYYKEGLAINQQMAEDEQARKLGLEADVQVQHDELGITINLPPQPFVSFNLYHIKDKARDISGAMALAGKNDCKSLYVYRLNKPIEGRWYLEIKGDGGQGENAWRLKGRLDLPMSGPVTLEPAGK